MIDPFLKGRARAVVSFRHGAPIRARASSSVCIHTGTGKKTPGGAGTHVYRYGTHHVEQSISHPNARNSNAVAADAPPKPLHMPRWLTNVNVNVKSTSSTVHLYGYDETLPVPQK